MSEVKGIHNANGEEYMIFPDGTLLRLILKNMVYNGAIKLFT
jgi:hypothetical protein